MALFPTLFCNSLRRRPSYASAIPTLLAQAKYHVRVPITIENDPHTGASRPTRHLRFLLLSPSTVTDGKLQFTIERIRHFSFLTNEPIAIVFLLNPPHNSSFQSAKHFAESAAGSRLDSVDGTLALTRLQAELIDQADLPCIPLLPLHSIDGLPTLLQSHAAKYVNQKPQQVHSTIASRDLMQLCTLRQPMQSFTGNVLSDTFDNLRDMAQAMTRPTNAPASSSPTAIAAFALDILSQPIERWDENGTLPFTEACLLLTVTIAFFTAAVPGTTCLQIFSTSLFQPAFFHPHRNASRNTHLVLSVRSLSASNSSQQTSTTQSPACTRDNLSEKTLNIIDGLSLVQNLHGPPSFTTNMSSG
ncbi:hypothetical protein CERZMDRAFT_80670 [Cercospora zeae-maydis SCOH1-5]|uniref:Uncharacterized protein n=1 Tax=Cercospora zeae-maydis SCOH1-5 TaxID=717836 RepID=A0A6A6FXZ1_9PEZI|nr:hypothetical protein CERZMDRAFT_80670 [Cercospora zeae-maydis SCOH1-5]